MCHYFRCACSAFETELRTLCAVRGAQFMRLRQFLAPHRHGTGGSSGSSSSL